MNTKTTIRGVSFWLLNCFVGASALLAGPTPRSEAGKTATPLPPEGGRIVIETPMPPTPVPLFFSATVDQTIRLGTAEIAGEAQVKIQIVQGKPEMLSLGLSGSGDVVEVVGKGLRDWAVRQAADGRKFLDVRPLLSPGTPDPRELELVVRTRVRKPAIPGNTTVTILTRGDAVGFSAKISLQADASVDFRVTNAAGLMPLGEVPTAMHAPVQFSLTGDGLIEIALTPRGAAAAPLEISNAQLVGRVNETTHGVDFRLRGQLRVQKAGARASPRRSRRVERKSVG